MNILFINNLYPHPNKGGIERVTMLISKFLTQNGYKCYTAFLTSSEYDNSWEFLKGFHIQDRWDANFFNNLLIDNSIEIIVNQGHLWYTPFIQPIANAIGVKYIGFHHGTTKFKVVSFCDAIKDYGLLIGLAIQLTYPIYKYRSLRRMRQVHRNSYKMADLTLVLCKSGINEYIKQLGIHSDARKIDFINNPLSFETTLSKDDLDKKENIMLVVARLENEKRIDIIIRAWKSIATEGWKMIIVGDGKAKVKLQSLVDKLAVHNIQFEGAQNSEGYYEKAKIFGMTSRAEGFGMTLTESFQKGVVPICFDSFPAARDIIDEGKNGFLVSDNSITDFASKLEILINNPTKLKEMAVNALNKSKDYELSIIGNKWISILTKLKNNESFTIN